MGAIQNSVNSLIGSAGAIAAVSEHLQGQKEANQTAVETKDLAQKQYDELNKPDYGQKLTNAQAERKAMASLLNSRYPGSLLKNYDPEKRIQNAQARMEYNELRKSYEAAKEKELNAGIDYNYPAGKQLVRDLTEEVDE